MKLGRTKLGVVINFKHRDLLAVVLISLLAASLRFYKLGNWGFWLDEIYSVRDAFHLTGQDIVQYTSDPKDTYYPLSYALIRLALALFGVNEWSARLVPALAGVISIPLIYLLVRKMFNSTTGLVSILLLSVSTWHLYWSQNARFYSLLFLLCNLSLLTFYLGIEGDDDKYMIVSGVLLAFGMLTHVTGVIILLALVSYPLILKLVGFQLPVGFGLKKILLFSAPPILPAIYLGLAVLNRQPAETTTMQMGGDPLRLLLGVSFYIGIAQICFALGGLVFLVSIKRSRPAVFLGVSAIVPLLMIAAASFFLVARNRYVFVVLLSWITLGACGIAELLSQVRGNAKLLVVGLLIAFVLGPLSEDMLYYEFQNGNREDWRNAFKYVERHRVEGDLIAVTFPAAGDYYLGEMTLWIPEMKPEDIELSGRRVWFVENDAIDWDYPGIQAWIKKNTELVANYDVHVNSARTYKMRVFLYDPLDR
jgi:mannosyltransferase